MARDTKTHEIFEYKEAMDRIAVITDGEESKYSDIPGWAGAVVGHGTHLAICLRIRDKDVWVPYSQLRKAEDEQSVYASLWILNERNID